MGAEMQLVGQLCAFVALLISVPGEVFVWDVATGQVKWGEKVLLSRWTP